MVLDEPSSRLTSRRREDIVDGSFRSTVVEADLQWWEMFACAEGVREAAYFGSSMGIGEDRWQKRHDDRLERQAMLANDASPQSSYLLRLSVSLNAESLIDDSPSVSLRSRKLRRREALRGIGFVGTQNRCGSSETSSSSDWREFSKLIKLAYSMGERKTVWRVAWISDMGDEGEFWRTVFCRELISCWDFCSFDRQSV